MKVSRVPGYPVLVLLCLFACSRKSALPSAASNHQPALSNPNAQLEDFVPANKRRNKDVYAPGVGHGHETNLTQDPQAMPLDKTHAFAGGLTWSAPDAFERQKPANAMRAAQYTMAKPGSEPSLLTVHFFGSDQGGDAEANIGRWIDQFSPTGRSVSRFSEKAKTFSLPCVEITGTYLGMSMPNEPASAPKPGYALYAAVAPGPEGPVFFKWVGPVGTLRSRRDAFLSLIRSIKTVN